MTMCIKTRVFVGAALLAGAGFTLPALAQDDCEAYAQIAVKQEKANEEKKCGQSGDGWSTDLKQHVDWCLSVSPDEWRKKIVDRQEKLDKCG